MSKKIGIGLLGILLVAPLAAAQEASLVSDNWDAVYLNDSKVGYMHSQTDLVDAGGASVVQSRMVSEMTVQRFNDPLTIKAMTLAFELPDGRLYAIDSQIRLANEVRRSSGRLGDDGKFRLTLQSGTNSDSQVIPWSDDVEGPYAHERSLRENPMKPGEKRTSHVFLPELNVVVTRSLTALDWEETKLHDGKTQRLLAIEDANDKIPQKGKIWINEAGEILKSEIPFGDLTMAAYRVPQAVALGKPTGEGVDIGYTTLVKPDRKIPNAHATRSVTYRLEFTDDQAAAAIPEASYQQILSREGNTLRLRVSRLEPGSNAGTTEEAGAEFLESNGFIQSDDPKIVAQAKQLTAGVDNAWKKVQLLEKWVDQNMTNRDFTIAFADAKEVFETRQGDCTEHAVLLAALCRAVGIPSRVAMGLVYLEGTGAFGYHMWTEVFINGTWYPADGTLGQGFIAGGHIKIADGSLKGASALSTLLPIFRVIGKMNIHVEEIR